MTETDIDALAAGPAAALLTFTLLSEFAAMLVEKGVLTKADIDIIRNRGETAFRDNFSDQTDVAEAWLRVADELLGRAQKTASPTDRVP